MDELNNEAVVSEDIDIYAGWDDDSAPADDAEDISEETTEAEAEETDQSESEEAEDASDDESTEELANELNNGEGSGSSTRKPKLPAQKDPGISEIEQKFMEIFGKSYL